LSDKFGSSPKGKLKLLSENKLELKVVPSAGSSAINDSFLSSSLNPF